MLFSVTLQVIGMLAVDGILSVATWAPEVSWAIVIASLPPDEAQVAVNNSEVYHMIFFAVAQTNCFTTPIIYFTFNNSYAVGVRIYNKIKPTMQSFNAEANVGRIVLPKVFQSY